MNDLSTPLMLPAVAALIDIIALIFAGLCIAAFAVTAAGIIWLCRSESCAAADQKLRHRFKNVPFVPNSPPETTFRRKYFSVRRLTPNPLRSARSALAAMLFVTFLLLLQFAATN